MIGSCGCVKAEVDVYFSQLGLDDSSLRNLAAETMTDYDQLKAIVKRTCGPVSTARKIANIMQLVPKSR